MIYKLSYNNNVYYINMQNETDIFNIEFIYKTNISNFILNSINNELKKEIDYFIDIDDYRLYSYLLKKYESLKKYILETIYIEPIFVDNL